MWIRFLGILILSPLAASAQFFDQWSVQTLPAEDRPYYGLAFGNDTFVVVGAGKIYSSPDATNWQSSRGIEGADIRAVTFANNRFVAVTEPRMFLGTGNILTSTNGRDWEIKNIGGHHLHAITFADGVFIAAGTHYISPDGTPRYEPRASFFRSANGIDWEYQFIDIRSDVRGIAYTDGIVVAVGNYSSSAGVIYRSLDRGITWEKSDLIPPLLTGVAGGKGKFVATGYSSNILISSDGLTWSPHDTALASALKFSAYLNGTFFAGSMHSGGFVASPDVQTWTTHTCGPDNANNSLTFGQGKFVGIGDLGNLIISGDVRTPALSITSSGQTVSIRTSGEVGKAYDLQATDDFINWTSVHRFTNETTLREFNETAGANRGFYRVTTAAD